MAINVDEIISKGHACGVVNIGVVNDAQRELGVVFPEDYVEFILKYGAVIFDGFEIYGLPDSSPSEVCVWQNVVDVTKSLRMAGQEGVADGKYIPISDDGMGSYFCINTDHSKYSEIWVVGPYESKIFCRTLDEFIIKQAEY